ncbi:MAG: MFS transporter [Solirubrobacteraceae bacterium]
MRAAPDMVNAARSRLSGLRDALATNLHSRDLRRAQLAFGAAWTSEWALTVGLCIVAFRDGGAAAVGLVALLRLAPSAVAGPFLAAIADRVRRERVMAAIGFVRGASIGTMAVLLAVAAPTAFVYALAVVSTIAGTPYRAAHSALLPSLCMTPEQLTSANAVRGMLDSLSTLVGPLIAAVLLEVSTPAAVFAAAAVASVWSAMLVLHLDYEAPPQPAAARRSTILADVKEGFRALATHRDVALLIGLAGAQTFTRGCLNVFTVVMAIELLDMGEAGVGILSAAVGAGAVLGSLGASLLVGSRRLGAWFGVSIALWGLPLVLIGVIPEQAAALALLAVIGVANAVLDVSGFSLIARLAPDEVLARVFGMFEALVALAIGLGSILTPLVIDAVGVRGALVVLGLVCPALAALSWLRLRKIDGSMQARDDELVHLRAVPMLQSLPVPVMDHLSRYLTRAHVPAGQAVFEQGDVGDRFYVIAAGEADVVGDGRGIRTLRSGDSFGEIALLRDVRRTTEVRARAALDLYTLERDVFVHAVSGYRPASAAADTAVVRMLETFRPRGVGV